MTAEDPAYNIKFSQILEKYPIIWNFNLEGYGKREATTQAWQKIAEQVDDSVANCRERWRNIRTAFVRSHRHYHSPFSKRKRPYYLNKYLHYLYPFAKLSDPSETITLKYEGEDNSVEIEETTLLNLDDSNLEAETNQEVSFLDCDENVEVYTEPGEDHKYVTLNVRKPKRMKKINHTNFLETQCSNKNVNATSSTSRDEDDCDLLFLRSLLPDIQKMTNRQKRNFKMQVLEIIDKVFDETQ